MLGNGNEFSFVLHPVTNNRTLLSNDLYYIHMAMFFQTACCMANRSTLQNDGLCYRKDIFENVKMYLLEITNEDWVAFQQVLNWSPPRKHRY